MKYAYLIIAHNECEVLSKLVHCLDDERNDIFIHFDKKVKTLPVLTTYKSDLYILENRIDTRWGDYSQIETEYALFEAAYAKGCYSRYILLSGVHLPLVTQQKIHEWFDERSQFEILAPVSNDDFQMDQKMHRFNLFTHSFAKSVNAQRMWRLCIAVQRLLGIRRNANHHYLISSNWVCLTSAGIEAVLNSQKWVKKEFRYSFCGDEFFVRTVLDRCSFGDRVLISDNLLFCDFAWGSSPRVLILNDYDAIKQSGCLFARKFGHTDMDVVERITIDVNLV